MHKQKIKKIFIICFQCILITLVWVGKSLSNSVHDVKVMNLGQKPGMGEASLDEGTDLAKRCSQNWLHFFEKYFIHRVIEDWCSTTTTT
jgi:hypothetical protein